MFLLCPVVLAGPRDLQSKRIAIELKTRLCIAHDDCSVIDPKEQLLFLLPFLITFVGRKLKDLKPVFVRVAKVKGFDAPGVSVPIGQTLWTSRSMFDFVFTQQRVSFVHVAGDDGNMLKPTIIAARINRNRTTSRSEVLSQFNKLFAQLHSHHAHAETKDAL